MWLVICSPFDVSGLWAYRALEGRGLSPVMLVSPEMMGYSLGSQLSLDARGSRLTLHLSDGRTIHSEETRGVLNRAVSIPTDHLQYGEPGDQEYAAQELTALFVSWLNAFPETVINRPSPQGLAGYQRHISEWVWLAYKAELHTPVFVQSSTRRNSHAEYRSSLAPPGAEVHSLIVLDDDVFGPSAPPEVIQGCRRLAELTGTGCLGVEFYQGTEGAWTFSSATCMPDLRIGGDPLIDALVSKFTPNGGAYT